jgi:hypothetical protein
MATGDSADVLGRLKAVLPRWFGDFAQAPVVRALLAGFAQTQSFVYSLYGYAALQTRIKVATDGWLDLIASDYFGSSVFRHSGETDAAFRSQIIANLFRERATRGGVNKILVDLTGRTPQIIEVLRPTDTGAYGGPYAGYGVAGAYASLVVPMTAFVTIFRPLSPTGGTPYGFSPIGGLYMPYGITGVSPYGYLPSDAELIAAAESVRPAGYSLEVRVSN